MLRSRKTSCGNIKPPVGSVLDWTDSINVGAVNCWLANEGSGGILSDIARKNNLVLTPIGPTGPTWAPAGANMSGNVPNLVAASSQYAEFAGAAVTAVPLTIAVYFKPTSVVGGTVALFTISKASSANINWFEILQVQTNVRVYAADGVNGFATTTSGRVTTDRYWMACGVFPAINSRTIYLNGEDAITDTTSVTPVSLDTTTLGARATNSTHGNFFGGGVLLARVWSRALIQREVQRLAFEPFAGIVAPRRRVIRAVAASGGTPVLDEDSLTYTIRTNW